MSQKGSLESPISPGSIESTAKKEEPEKDDTLSQSVHIEKTPVDLESDQSSEHVVYKVYKRRWLGIVTLVSLCALLHSGSLG